MFSNGFKENYSLALKQCQHSSHSGNKRNQGRFKSHPILFGVRSNEKNIEV